MCRTARRASPPRNQPTTNLDRETNPKRDQLFQVIQQWRATRRHAARVLPCPSWRYRLRLFWDQCRLQTGTTTVAQDPREPSRHQQRTHRKKASYFCPFERGGINPDFTTMRRLGRMIFRLYFALRFTIGSNALPGNVLRLRNLKFEMEQVAGWDRSNQRHFVRLQDDSQKSFVCRIGE